MLGVKNERASIYLLCFNSEATVKHGMIWRWVGVLGLDSSNWQQDPAEFSSSFAFSFACECCNSNFRFQCFLSGLRKYKGIPALHIQNFSVLDLMAKVKRAQELCMLEHHICWSA